jgi:hypothetical protein
MKTHYEFDLYDLHCLARSVNLGINGCIQQINEIFNRFKSLPETVALSGEVLEQYLKSLIYQQNLLFKIGFKICKKEKRLYDPKEWNIVVKNISGSLLESAVKEFCERTPKMSFLYHELKIQKKDN